MEFQHYFKVAFDGDPHKHYDYFCSEEEYKTTPNGTHAIVCVSAKYRHSRTRASGTGRRQAASL